MQQLYENTPESERFYRTVHTFMVLKHKQLFINKTSALCNPTESFLIFEYEVLVLTFFEI